MTHKFPKFTSTETHADDRWPAIYLPQSDVPSHQYQIISLVKGASVPTICSRRYQTWTWPSSEPSRGLWREAATCYHYTSRRQLTLKRRRSKASTLLLRSHWMVGSGSPVATQCSMTDWPSTVVVFTGRTLNLGFTTTDHNVQNSHNTSFYCQTCIHYLRYFAKIDHSTQSGWTITQYGIPSLSRPTSNSTSYLATMYM